VNYDALDPVVGRVDNSSRKYSVVIFRFG